jgi:hypothetical protein
MRRAISKQILLLGAILGAAACDSVTSPFETAPAGSYTATTFLTGSTGQTDELALGSTLTLHLYSNGNVSGHLHTAASGGNPATDADMAGTWMLTGNVVDISQPADTFVRNMHFTFATATNGTVTLSDDRVFTGGRVQLVLTRTPPIG